MRNPFKGFLVLGICFATENYIELQHIFNPAQYSVYSVRQGNYENMKKKGYSNRIYDWTSICRRFGSPCWIDGKRDNPENIKDHFSISTLDTNSYFSFISLCTSYILLLLFKYHFLCITLIFYGALKIYAFIYFFFDELHYITWFTFIYTLKHSPLISICLIRSYTFFLIYAYISLYPPLLHPVRVGVFRFRDWRDR